MKIDLRLKQILLVAVVCLGSYLLIFGFRQSQDGPFWIGAAKFLYSGGAVFDHLSFHYVENPVIPLIAGALQGLGVSYFYGYLLLNSASVCLTALLLFNFWQNYVERRIAFVASVLFLIDFHTFIFGLRVMPDAFTWLCIMLVIYLAGNCCEKILTRYKLAIGWGILIGFLILVKQSFVFLLPLPLSDYLRTKKIDLPRLISIFLAGAIIPLAYYAFIGLAFKHTPWESLIDGEKNLPRSFYLYATNFIGAYLYTLPLAVVGLWLFVKKGLHHDIFLVWATILCAIPIFIWPYIMSRFFFTLFWIVLPIAAMGIVKIFKKRIYIHATLGFLLVFNLLRSQMFFANVTHWQFLLSLFGR